MRDTPTPDALAARAAHATPEPTGAAPALTPPPGASDELSDADLDEVVGGLARVWSDHAIARLVRG